jgi:hypothetical protein
MEGGFIFFINPDSCFLLRTFRFPLLHLFTAGLCFPGIWNLYYLHLSILISSYDTLPYPLTFDRVFFFLSPFGNTQNRDRHVFFDLTPVSLLRPYFRYLSVPGCIYREPSLYPGSLVLSPDLLQTPMTRTQQPDEAHLCFSAECQRQKAAARSKMSWQCYSTAK